MTISIWRYSHFLLAIISSLFLLITSVTGVVLAVEPIQHQTNGYIVADLSKVTLATTIESLQANYEEVFALEVERSGFVKASVLTPDLETKEIYIDPITSETLGEVSERPFIYSFATNLHRSLFLKSTGRVFVGIFSFLLCCIAFTGLFLLIKRQGGIKRLFSNVQKEYAEMRYHVILSRWFFLPIIIIAISGVYLSAEKFDLLPEASVVFNEDLTENTSNTFKTSVFQQTTLNKVRTVEFPFSEDPEEYFQIALQDQELRVNQQTGAVISSAPYPFITLASRVSWMLHTGEGNALWAMVLLLASASIIFFMYSGFVMTIKRRKRIATNVDMPDKDACEYIILVGSETGSTYQFAQSFYKALTEAGKKVYLTELNNYMLFAEARHIIVFTATYGEGEATTNARKFETLLPSILQSHAIQYSVVGFGSLEYPDYCRFAIKVDGLLQVQQTFQPLLPLYKINNSEREAFKNWAKQWSEATNIDLRLALSEKKKTKLKKIPFEVIERTELNLDDTFLLKLKPLKKTRFVSGDLLHVFVEGNEVSRQYSIARIDDTLVLSIKRHEFGKASTFLYQLEEGAVLEAAVASNKHFHFPKKISSAVLIANGTGIAPFLGMINENKATEIHLFWGGRTLASVAIYEKILKKNFSEGNRIKFYTGFSREGNKEYVQDLLAKQSEMILGVLENNGCLMLCGSLSMQNDVLDTLEEILDQHDLVSLDILKHRGQLKMDCY